MLGGIRGVGVAAFVGQLTVIAVVIVIGGSTLPGAAASTQAYLLTLLPVLAAQPVAADLAGVRQLAFTVHGTAAAQFEQLLVLLRLLSGLLTALGGFAALTTLTIGAQMPLLGGPTPALLVIFGASVACSWRSLIYRRRPPCARAHVHCARP